jgi:hypothetical protein
MQSKATTVDEYLANLPAERRALVETVRQTILANLDSDIEEGMQYGMIGYYVPHRVFPAGYHVDPAQPLPFAALASQKNHMALYLMSVYTEGEEAEWFRHAWEKASPKKLDMGKSCVRFRKLEDVPLEVVGKAIRRVPAARHIANYKNSLNATRPATSAKRIRKKAAK